MKQLSGFYNDYSLNGITYKDKIGEDYEVDKMPYYVTYKDMNEIKNAINNNIDSMSKFSSDVIDKVNSLDLGRIVITDDEENKIMNKLGIS